MPDKQPKDRLEAELYDIFCDIQRDNQSIYHNTLKLIRLHESWLKEEWKKEVEEKIEKLDEFRTMDEDEPLMIQKYKAIDLINNI